MGIVVAVVAALRGPWLLVTVCRCVDLVFHSVIPLSVSGSRDSVQAAVQPLNRSFRDTLWSIDQRQLPRLFVRCRLRASSLHHQSSPPSLPLPRLLFQPAWPSLLACLVPTVPHPLFGLLWLTASGRARLPNPRTATFSCTSCSMNKLFASSLSITVRSLPAVRRPPPLARLLACSLTFATPLSSLPKLFLFVCPASRLQRCLPVQRGHDLASKGTSCLLGRQRILPLFHASNTEARNLHPFHTTCSVPSIDPSAPSIFPFHPPCCLPPFVRSLLEWEPHNPTHLPPARVQGFPANGRPPCFRWS